MYRIGIFASGEGTNAQRFMEYFKNRRDISISLVVTNNAKAGVIERAKKMNIPYMLIDKDIFYNTDKIINELKTRVDFIVLAGFMWMVPENLIKAFPHKIVNIHPALLPGYGGKGMYGIRVHEAVIKNKEKKSGISIHYVNENYDEGEIIKQYECGVSEADTPETLSRKIHKLEYEHYPETIEKLLLGNIS
ncbi:MAG: phosphoribosylglycinamide formyltransferase [Bacteroidia bacterium]